MVGKPYFKPINGADTHVICALSFFYAAPNILAFCPIQRISDDWCWHNAFIQRKMRHAIGVNLSTSRLWSHKISKRLSG